MKGPGLKTFPDVYHKLVGGRDNPRAVACGAVWKGGSGLPTDTGLGVTDIDEHVTCPACKGDK